MRDALRKHFTGLDGRDDPMFKKTSGAISCRLLVWWFPWFPYRIKLTSSQVPWVSTKPLNSGEDHSPVLGVAC